jgi:hypothetical protein
MKYRAKPTIKEAIQYTGENLEEVMQFIGLDRTPPPIEGMTLVINTLEGNMHAAVNDYIIKGIKGEFYPCKPEIFEASYEKVEKTLEDYIQEEIQNGPSHYESFDGMNCHDVNDDWNEGKKCTGWTVGEHRCDCGNRRMTWGGHQNTDGSWDVWPEAY